MRLRAFIAGIMILSFMGCAVPPPKEPLRPEEPPRLLKEEFPFPLIDDLDKVSLRAAIEKSLTYLGKKNSVDNPFLNSPKRSSSESFAGFLTPGETYRSLTLFREILLNTSDELDFEKRVRERFIFSEGPAEGQPKPILLTGYFEPVFEGSLRPMGEYRYPIYRPPDDLVKIQQRGSGEQIIRLERGQAVPYYSRREIDTEGLLQGRGLELAWLKDPWERFVLHVQGSGKIRLPGGEILGLGFAASNGRPYTSIGRYLVERGFIEEKGLSLRLVKEFLMQHPERMEEIFNVNERYVFFLPVQAEDGPRGALGVSLTAGRSIATDHSFFPRGALAYLISREPNGDKTGEIAGWKTLRRFVLNQDTGAAIKGPYRVDLFFGTGEKAGLAAGEMREEGKIYLLRARESGR